MNLARWLQRAARVHPQRPALLHGERVVACYGELAERVARQAGHLRHGLGLVPGDRVALFMHNEPAYLELMYAALWAGLAVVPINAKLHPKEAEFIVGDSAARVLFVSPALAAPLLDGARSACRPCATSWSAARRLSTPPSRSRRSRIEDRAPDDLAWLFYTSGTTGRPKGVMQTQRNLQAMTGCYFIDVDDVAADDAIVYAAPMSHGAGMYNFPFMARGARHVVPASGGFDPAELVALSHSVGRLCLFAAPTMVKRLVEHIAATRRGRATASRPSSMAAGRCTSRTSAHALATMGPRFVQIYGQGESPMTITALSRAMLADTAPPATCRAHRLGGRGADAGRGAGGGRTTARRCPSARPARSWCAATPSWPATGATPRPPRARCATGGCGPATWARSTPTVS